MIPAACVLIGLASCTQPTDTTPATASNDISTTSDIASHILPPALSDDKPADYPGLHNVVTYADGMYSGSVPEGEAGFQSLEALGVKTIISVDGAQPDIETASQYGLRYVHLPIGYNGMDEQRTLEIARALRDLPGPVYLHCHHGKHRSAGALGAGVVTLGMLSNDQAIQRMKVSGTAPHYTGLYGCVAVASIADQAELDAADNTFPQRYRTTGMVQSMVEIDEVYEYLKLIEKAGWTAPADHPDLVPVAEAGRLADLYRHLLDDEQVQSKPDEFQKWTQRASEECSALEEGLLASPINPAELTAHFALITQSCKECHSKYRD